MVETNPYNRINPRDFLIRKVTSSDTRSLFVVETSEHSPFDVCNFRRFLVDTLMEEMKGPWGLRSNKRTNNYELDVDTGWDERVLRELFRVA